MKTRIIIMSIIAISCIITNVNILVSNLNTLYTYIGIGLVLLNIIGAMFYRNFYFNGIVIFFLETLTIGALWELPVIYHFLLLFLVLLTYGSVRYVTTKLYK